MSGVTWPDVALAAVSTMMSFLIGLGFVVLVVYVGWAFFRGAANNGPLS